MGSSDKRLGIQIEELLELVESDLAASGVDGLLESLDGIGGQKRYVDRENWDTRAEDLFKKGVAAMKQGDFLMASAWFFASDALRPDSVKTLNNLGISLFRLGRREAAQEVLERAVSIEPDNDIAAKNLEKVKQWKEVGHD